MEQKMLFESKKSLSPSKNRNRDPWHEDTLPNLEFILVPYAILLGLATPAPVVLSEQESKQLFYKLFRPLNRKVDRVQLLTEVKQFLDYESIRTKKDPSKPLRGNNLTSEEFSRMLLSGALAMEVRHTGIEKLKRALRKNLPGADQRLYFSRIGRYLLNGRNSDDWYVEINALISELFPNFDKELIVSLLAITSSATDVASNITKMFKVLKQFYENKTYVVPIGKRSEKTFIESSFYGVVDAQIVHLNALKGGSRLADLSKKNARKIREFAANMLLLPAGAVVDRWIQLAFNCVKKSQLSKGRLVVSAPSRSLYRTIDWYVQTLATLIGVDPGALCASIWAGLRKESSTTDDRYVRGIKKRFDHGLFKDQFGELVVSKKGGIEFERK